MHLPQKLSIWLLAMPCLLGPMQVVAGTAHERSAFAATVDPAYSATALKPATEEVSGAPWFYGDGEYEAYRLKQLRERSDGVCAHVGYPGKYYQPAVKVWFRLAVRDLPESLKIRAGGDGIVSFEGREVSRFAVSAKAQAFAFPEALRGQTGTLQIELSTTNGEPPALLIESATTAWESSVDGVHWAAAQPIPQVASGLPPHRSELPTLEIQPQGKQGEVFDFGRELLGNVSFHCDGQPKLWVGESIPEVMEENIKRLDQHTDLARGDDGLWRSQHQLALRYARITGGTATDLKVDAVFRPGQYRGAFACSDERLTRIWMHSAFTLRSCMNHLMLDGVKRDRLPWIGDQAVNLAVNAYTFADADIIRRSFTALGRNGIEASDINGIVDYSLWWIISNDQFQRFFDDPVYLQREWPRLKSAVEFMEKQCDASGYLVPRPGTWLFIDWGISKKKELTNVPLQALWFWALQSAAALADRTQHADDAVRWRSRATTLAATLREKAWDAEAKGWKMHVEETGALSRHANLLAVLSGLATEDQLPSIKQHLLANKLPPILTPFMGTLELTALARLGAYDAIPPRIEAFWGKQLDHGATTFWEQFKPGDLYSMYSRPFANSHCHAWASGPAAVLPAEILGIRPLADGWKRFSVAPHLGSLEWAAATVPAGAQNIEVEARRSPAGLTLTVICSPGLSAEVTLPTSTELRANGVVIWSGGRAGQLPPGIKRVRNSAGALAIEIDSGQWKFFATH
jgi:alpha-L-rhamnosidase